MICYRDKTYCCSNCSNAECDRFISDEVRKASQAVKLPLATTDFSAQCAGYQVPRRDVK